MTSNSVRSERVWYAISNCQDGACCARDDVIGTLA